MALISAILKRALGVFDIANFFFFLLFSFLLFLCEKEGLVKIARDVVLGRLAGCCLGIIPGNGG